MSKTKELLLSDKLNNIQRFIIEKLVEKHPLVEYNPPYFILNTEKKGLYPFTLFSLNNPFDFIISAVSLDIVKDKMNEMLNLKREYYTREEVIDLCEKAFYLRAEHDGNPMQTLNSKREIAGDVLDEWIENNVK